MSKEIKHTPTPWLLTGDGMNGKNIDLDEMVFFGCDLGRNTKENAKHIVKCVNENEALHARIKTLEQCFEGMVGIAVKRGEENSALTKKLEAKK